MKVSELAIAHLIVREETLPFVLPHLSYNFPISEETCGGAFESLVPVWLESLEENCDTGFGAILPVFVEIF